MKKIPLLLLIAILSGVVAHAQLATHIQTTPSNQPYWQQEVNYTINVSLNDVEHSLDGLAKIKYTNNSPDTLFFIWFHCWPNAYKSDRTAFSEQLLGNGRTDFYFSDKQQRGYLNRLNFRVEGITARVEDHPQYIDIVKLELPAPLAPGKQIEISASFHEQLPFIFSRGGHLGQSYQITQWYPKPAVYDREGWHPMPYLDQGDVFSEYGDYDVTIRLPANYGVAATGELVEGDPGSVIDGNSATKAAVVKPATRNTAPTKSSTAKSSPAKPARPPLLAQAFSQKNRSLPRHIPSDTTSKTLRFRQHQVQDFAWFADKSFRRDQDTLLLSSGRIVRINCFYTRENAALWKNSIRYAKDAIRFRSSILGEYPFTTLTVVESKSKNRSGMEYPGLIALAPPPKSDPFGRYEGLATSIGHEIGFSWFGDALGSDRRQYPWMNEGMNAYYDRRYETTTRPARAVKPDRPSRSQIDDIFASTLIELHQDQPIASSSTGLTALNYKLMAATKTAN